MTDRDGQEAFDRLRAQVDVGRRAMGKCRVMRKSLLSAPGFVGRLLSVCARLATVVCLGATTVACGPPPPPKKVESAEERADKEKFNKAKQLIDKSNAAYGDKDFDKARKLLREANERGVEALTFQSK